MADIAAVKPLLNTHRFASLWGCRATSSRVRSLNPAASTTSVSPSQRPT